MPNINVRSQTPTRTRPSEARAVAREDPRLVYLTLKCTGWTVGDGSGHDGYNVIDYFIGGEYLGPDEHGIEPIMEQVDAQ